LIDGRESMSLASSCLALINPLLNCLVFVPSIISGKDFDTWHVWLVKNFILFVEEGNGIFRCLVFINDLFLLGQEGCLLLNFVVLLDDICVSGRETLNSKF